MRYQGRIMHGERPPPRASYRLLAGDPLSITHHGNPVTIGPDMVTHDIPPLKSRPHPGPALRPRPPAPQNHGRLRHLTHATATAPRATPHRPAPRPSPARPRPATARPGRPAPRASCRLTASVRAPAPARRRPRAPLAARPRSELPTPGSPTVLADASVATVERASRRHWPRLQSIDVRRHRYCPGRRSRRFKVNDRLYRTVTCVPPSTSTRARTQASRTGRC